MNVLLIGNYRPRRQPSMLGFEALMVELLSAAGVNVRVAKPPEVFGNAAREYDGVAKWKGYLDRYLFAPPVIRWAARWADVVHVCDHSNAFYLPLVKGKAQVVTCHDTFAIEAGLGAEHSSVLRRSGRFEQRIVWRELRRSHRVVCVSASTRADLLRLDPRIDGKLAVVPNAMRYPFRPMPRPEALAIAGHLSPKVHGRFLLHVGNNSWYKNRPTALRIFAELARLPGQEDLAFVTAGPAWPQVMVDLANSHDIASRAVNLPATTDLELCALYSLAGGLVFPSLREGFGWPIIEAQACGCPVFTSDRAPMTDVGGKGAVYFDPADEAGAAHAIAGGLTVADSLRAEGLSNATRFARESMTAGYLAAYEAALSESKRGKRRR